MTERGHYISGVLFTLLYILIASAQSVALNIWLHGVNVFLVVGPSFLIVTVVFALVGYFRQRHAYSRLLSHWRFLMALNAVSVCNWLFYFLAVKYLEPSIAVTLTQGLGPVSMTAYALFRREPVSAVTRICHATIFAMATAICIYALRYRDALGFYGRGEMVLGIVLAAMCSISITATIRLSKQFAANRIPAPVLLSLRFPLLIFICFGALPLQHGLSITADILYAIVLIALIGVCASTYFLQKGIELAPSLAVSTVLALSPLTVFLIQLLNGHTPFSLALFVMIMIIVAASIVSVAYDARQVGRLAASSKAAR